MQKEISHNIRRRTAACGGLYTGIFRKAYLLLPVILFAAAAMAVFCFRAARQEYPIPSAMECFIDFFKGMKRLGNSSPMEYFRIEPCYLLFNLYISALIARQPLGELNGMDTQVMIRLKSRRRWLSAKYVYCAELVALCYLSAAVSALAVAGAAGANHFWLGCTIQPISGVSTAGISAAQCVLSAVVLPVAVSVSLAVFQLTVSLFVKPVYAFAVNTVILVVSAYVCHPCLPGNYLMLMRNESFGGELFAGWGFAASVLIAAVSAAGGYIRVKRYDIIKTEPHFH